MTARGVAHLVVHGTSGSTSYDTIPHVPFETSGGVLSTVDMVVQRRDGPRRPREPNDDDDVYTRDRELQFSSVEFVYCERALCMVHGSTKLPVGVAVCTLSRT